MLQYGKTVWNRRGRYYRCIQRCSQEYLRSCKCCRRQAFACLQDAISIDAFHHSACVSYVVVSASTIYMQNDSLGVHCFTSICMTTSNSTKAFLAALQYILCSCCLLYGFNAAFDRTLSIQYRIVCARFDLTLSHFILKTVRQDDSYTLL